MNQIFQWINQHQAISGAAGLWLFSAAVSGMQAPKDNSGAGYVWLYNTLHILSSNLNKLSTKTNNTPEPPPHVTPQPPEVK